MGLGRSSSSGAGSSTTKLSGGYAAGEAVFSTISYQFNIADDGSDYCLVEGTKGEVVGEATNKKIPAGKGLKVKFLGEGGTVDILLEYLSRTLVPPLAAGDTVYSTNMWDDKGNVLRGRYGLKGKVIGPGSKRSRLKVQFDGHDDVTECNSVRWALGQQPPPPLPMGWKVADVVYSRITNPPDESGDSVEFGLVGEVVGPDYDPDAPENIAVQFDTHSSTSMHSLHATHLSRTLPRPPPLPDGYEYGGPVYKSPNWDTWVGGEKLSSRIKGTVLGLEIDRKTGEVDNTTLRVHFPPRVIALPLEMATTVPLTPYRHLG